MNNRKPKYQIALDNILKMIREDAYKKGEKIPSIQQLAKAYGISISSIWQAINILKERDVINVIPKSGIYIKTSLCDNTGIIDDAGIIPDNEFNSGFFINTDMGPMVKPIRFNVCDRHPKMLQFYRDIISDYSRRNQYVRIILVADGPLPAVSINDNDPADIFQLPSHNIVPFIKADKLVNLAETDIPVIDKDAFFKPSLEAVSHDDKLWGVPFLIAEHCIFYNRNMSSISRGLKEAQTFWELMSYISGLSKQLVEKKWETVVATAMDPLSFPLHAGFKWPEYYEDMLEFKDDVKNFFSRFSNFYLEPSIFWRSKNINDMKQHKLLSLFLENKVPFYFTNSNLLILPSRSELDVMTWPVSGNSRIPASINVNCVSSTSKFPDECMGFMEYLASEDVQRAYAKLGILMSRKDACDACYDSPVKVNWAELISSVDKIKTYKSNHIDIDKIREMIVFLEFYKWQINETDFNSLIKTIQRNYLSYIKNRN